MQNIEHEDSTKFDQRILKIRVLVYKIWTNLYYNSYLSVEILV